MARQKGSLSEKFKRRGSKKLSTERKQAVINFLSRDENSRLLAGKKDTITKNKLKMQRRVLTKPLIELHAQYKTEVQQHLSMSYRQFARRRPFISPSRRPGIEIHVHVWNMRISGYWSTNLPREGC